MCENQSGLFFMYSWASVNAWCVLCMRNDLFWSFFCLWTITLEWAFNGGTENPEFIKKIYPNLSFKVEQVLWVWEVINDKIVIFGWTNLLNIKQVSIVKRSAKQWLVVLAANVVFAVTTSWEQNYLSKNHWQPFQSVMQHHAKANVFVANHKFTPQTNVSFANKREY